MRPSGVRSRTTTVALVVIGVGSVVAAALAGGRVDRRTSALQVIDASAVLEAIDSAVVTTGIILAVVVLSLLAWVLARGGTVAHDRTTWEMLRKSARFILLLYVAVAAAIFLLPRMLPQLGERTGPSANAPVAPVDGNDGASPWWPLALVVAASASSMIALWMVRERRGTPGAELVETIRGPLVGALEDLDHGAYADDVVIAAFQRMELAFRDRGLSRRRAETTAEFVTRVMASLSVDDDALHELEAVYEHARFARTPVTSEGRDAARAALGRLLEDVGYG